MDSPEKSGFGRYPLENIALGLLMPGPKHGYDLYQDFESEFRLIWKAGQAKFYVTLNKLEQEGLLDAVTEPQEGRPARKIYHLTENGRDAFMEWLHRPVWSMRAVRVELIAKLRFFELLHLPGVDKLVDQQLQVWQSMLAEWEQPDIGDDVFQEIVVDFRRQQAQFLIDWLTDCKQRLFIYS